MRAFQPHIAVQHGKQRLLFGVRQQHAALNGVLAGGHRQLIAQKFGKFDGAESPHFRQHVGKKGGKVDVLQIEGHGGNFEAAAAEFLNVEADLADGREMLGEKRPLFAVEGRIYGTSMGCETTLRASISAFSRSKISRSCAACWSMI